MSQSKMNIAALLAVVLLAATSAYAYENPDTQSEINQRIGIGDPVVGKEKAAFCEGCHGEGGLSASPVFPKLAGQWSDYIQKQVREFQNGARYNEIMTDMATSVFEFQDVFDIAAYFASQKQMAGTPLEDEESNKLYLEGEKLYNQGNAENGAFRCVKCHGEHGSGQPLNNNLFPVLVGQHKDYLVKQLTEFKHEFRENDRSGMMLRITTNLTEHDIDALATYLCCTLTPKPPPPPPEPTPPPAPVELIDKPITIKGATFKVGFAKLDKEAIKQLKVVLDFAKSHPEAKLEIIGYTDSTGSDQLNMRLSQARADLVKKYLVKKGVSGNRINTQGLGPSNPVADNSTVEGRAENRRVEIKAVIKEQKKVPASN
jgi:outer membrane protein OmpA-like peptidoglycan-associated protein